MNDSQSEPGQKLGGRLTPHALAKSAPGQELIAVAKAVRTRGLKGEIVAELLTDFPERFEGLQSIIGIAPHTGARLSLDIESHFPQSDRIVIKFAGWDNVEAARLLVGYEFAVPEADRVPLPDDEYYDYELIDCRVVTIAGIEVGFVSDVLKTGGVPMLVVQSAGSRERLIPLADAICVEVNVAEKLIRIDAPQGLLEL